MASVQLRLEVRGGAAVEDETIAESQRFETVAEVGGTRRGNTDMIKSQQHSVHGSGGRSVNSVVLEAGAQDGTRWSASFPSSGAENLGREAGIPGI